MADPVLVTFQLLDDFGNVTSLNYFYDFLGTLTLTQINTNILTVGDAIEAMTGSVITAITMKNNVDFTGQGWKTDPVADTENAATLHLNFAQTDSKYTATIAIPGLRDTLITGGKPVLAGAIQDFVDIVVAGTAILGGVVSKEFHFLPTLRKAYITFRKRRGMRAKTAVIP